MKEIEIKNFGPITDGYNGLMPISPITVFCGNQGAGKSTVAKLISTFTWMEKALIRGDVALNKKTDNASFLKQQCEFHRIHNYFKPDTEIHFKGTRYNFHYQHERFSVEPIENGEDYPMPKIMYVPAERNFLSVVEHPDTLKEIPESLYVLFSEYDKARRALKKEMKLPLDGFSFQYDKLNNVSWLKGVDFKVMISEAASGFQSMIPMVLVTHYLEHVTTTGQKAATNLQQENTIQKRIASILADDSIDEDMRKLLLNQQSALLKYGQFVNIVEEPEQNLYPTAQKSILFDLFAAYNASDTNQLIITTHSPYLIDYTTLAIKAATIKPTNDEQAMVLEGIVPKKARIKGEDVCIYQIQDGQILPLKKYDDLPSDDNMLNRELSDTNDLFARMTRISTCE